MFAPLPLLNPAIQTHESAKPPLPPSKQRFPAYGRVFRKQMAPGFSSPPLLLPFERNATPAPRERAPGTPYALGACLGRGRAGLKGATGGKGFPKRPSPPASRGEKKQASPSYLGSAFAPSGSCGSRSLVAKPDPPRSSRSQSSLKTPAEQGQQAPHSARPLRGLAQDPGSPPARGLSEEQRAP